jgi:hypothetical protein
MDRRQTHVVRLLAFVVLVLVASSARAQVAVTKFKAAFVAIILTKHVEFTDDPDRELNRIGVLGDNPFKQGNIDYLKHTLEAKGRDDVEVRHFADISEYRPCDILVVSQSADFQAALEKTSGKPVLVVTQAPGRARQGAMVNFIIRERYQGRTYIEEPQVEINPGAAKRVGLTVKSKVFDLSMVEKIE